MRKMFVDVASEIIAQDPKTVLLLGDIGVYGFRHLATVYSNRIFNMGIAEQSLIGVAAGMSMSGLTPIVHTIAPFLIERPLEQLKIDFGYQRNAGNFVSVGASYDYSKLGATHHAPADVLTLLGIPGFQIIVPGTAAEFSSLMLSNYNNGKANYFRLSEKENEFSIDLEIGKGKVVKHGKLATIIVVGPLLDLVLDSYKNLDVEIIYINSVNPFDFEIIAKNCASSKILIVEPFYEGTMSHLVQKAAENRPLQIQTVGIKREFITRYGEYGEISADIGFTSQNLLSQLDKLIKL